jgi:hypothetical protein
VSPLAAVATIAVGGPAALLGVGWFVLRPRRILCAIAATVSIVAINVNLGVTLYLDRLLIAILLVAVIVHALRGSTSCFRRRLDPRFFLLFGAILLAQCASLVLASDRTSGLRLMLMYVGAMVVFTAVLLLGKTPRIIIQAVRWYLACGVLQGAVGVYQVLGMSRGWPVYQQLLSGLPTTNDRTNDGYLWYSAYQTPRAFGFFSSDVNHYAGYMTGIIILGLALLAGKRSGALPYWAIAAGTAGLVLSLSRSGIVTLVAIGLPILFFLLGRAHLPRRWLIRTIAIALVASAVIGSVGFIWQGATELGFPDVRIVIASRMRDLLQPSVNEVESAGMHWKLRKTALEAWMSSPLVGVGLGNGVSWFSRKDPTLVATSHTHHLDILAETGLVGAGLEWTLMCFVTWSMWKGVKRSAPKSESRVLLVGILATYLTVLGGNLFYRYYQLDFAWFLMGAGVALSSTVAQEERRATAASTAVPPTAQQEG